MGPNDPAAIAHDGDILHGGVFVDDDAPTFGQRPEQGTGGMSPQQFSPLPDMDGEARKPFDQSQGELDAGGTAPTTP
ncbi:MAG: hypothetical protein HC918_10085, partial [Oscillatoriales cyanobacterium SM2_1_8]|nr:hypothetical protein [Oscillatoriales cyanobacterium SM2_1_8]